PALPRDLAPGHEPHTGDNRRLMHIKTGNSLMHHVHRRSSHASAAGMGTSPMNSSERAPRAGDAVPLAPVGVIEVPRVKLTNGLFRTKEQPTSAPTATPNYTTGHSIQSFIQGGSAAGRWETNKKLGLNDDSMNKSSPSGAA